MPAARREVRRGSYSSNGHGAFGPPETCGISPEPVWPGRRGAVAALKVVSGTGNQNASRLLTIGRPTTIAVATHVLPWVPVMAVAFFGSLAQRGAPSIAISLSLVIFGAMVFALVAQTHQVDLETGVIHLRSWWSIMQEKPGQEILLRPDSRIYRDSLGRVFVDEHEVRLYLGLGWKRIARWFEQAGLAVYDDQSDLAAGRPTMGPIFRVGRWPVAALLYVAALLLVWNTPDAFSVTVLCTGILLLTYYFVVYDRKWKQRR
jgi:hypothetical protein